jgi:DNA invertase Pin-like site-specific DNA recombinase
MPNYVAYYRVSTDKQGKSGLGLDAQRQAVTAFVDRRGEILTEFTEVESTRNQRPQLQAALEICRKKKATLLIARLDRLARNVAFISNLMESRVDFVAVDMPEANRLTIHILAAVAEYEREAISKRTKDALKVAKARGTRLGNPDPLSALRVGAKALKVQTAEYHATVRPLIRDLRQQGLTLAAIAHELNRRHVPTARGGLWYAATVRNILIWIQK